jgi:hypothetical protein
MSVNDETLNAGSGHPRNVPHLLETEDLRKITAERRWRWINLARWLLGYLAFVAVCGLLGGVFWFLAVDPPTYTISDDFRAQMTEADIVEIFSTDFWFVLAGFLIGMALGVLAWYWFSILGWPVVVIATGGAVIAGLVCWWFGTVLGPDHFMYRLANAQPGAEVPIDLTVHAPVGLAVWAAGAVLSVMFASSWPRNSELRRGYWVQHDSENQS